jgi:carbamoylphosphate synthase large subunit
MLRGLRQVVHDDTASGDIRSYGASRQRCVVIPLLENHAMRCPRNCRTALPTLEAISTLGDKLSFARFANTHTLEHFIPTHFRNSTEATYPCVIKRTNLNASVGVRIVNSLEELLDIEQRPPWRDKPYVLQEFIEAHREYTAHLFVKRGEILWSAAYAYEAPPLRNLTAERQLRPSILEDRDRHIIEQFLRPFLYTGPCNVDYTLRNDGRIAIFEINPRLGGSLMRDDRIEDLATMLQHIIDHATL